MFVFGVVWRLTYEFKELNRNSFPSVAAYAVLVVGIPVYVRSFASALLALFVWFLLHVAVFRWLGATGIGNQVVVRFAGPRVPAA